VVSDRSVPFQIHSVFSPGLTPLFLLFPLLFEKRGETPEVVWCVVAHNFCMFIRFRQVLVTSQFLFGLVLYPSSVLHTPRRESLRALQSFLVIFPFLLPFFQINFFSGLTNFSSPQFDRTSFPVGKPPEFTLPCRRRDNLPFPPPHDSPAFS